MVDKASTTDVHESRHLRTPEHITSAKLGEDSTGARANQTGQDHAKIAAATKDMEASGKLPPCSVAEAHRLHPCGSQEPEQIKGAKSPIGHPQEANATAKSGDKQSVGTSSAPSDKNANSPTEKAAGVPGREQGDAKKSSQDAGGHPHDGAHHAATRHHKAHDHHHHHKGHHPGHHKAHHGHKEHGKEAGNSPTSEHHTAAHAERSVGADTAKSASHKPGDKATSTTTAGKAAEQAQKPGDNSLANNATAGKANDQSQKPQGAADGTMAAPGLTNDQTQKGITAAETKKANEGCPTEGAMPHESPQQFMDALKSYGYSPAGTNDGKAVTGATQTGKPSDGKAVGTAGHPGIPADGRLQGQAIDPSQALTASDKGQTHQLKSIGDPGMTKTSKVGDVDPG
jgi:hypothetical protein